MHTEFDHETFIKERDEALLSLDKEKILVYAKKYGIQLALLWDDDIFWKSVHKAITGNKNLPVDFRRKSKQWLTERNSRSFDDGDL